MSDQTKPTGLNWHPISEPIPETLDMVAFIADQKAHVMTHWAEINGPGQPSPEAEKLKRLREAARRFVKEMERVADLVATTGSDDYSHAIRKAAYAMEKELER